MKIKLFLLFTITKTFCILGINREQESEILTMVMLDCHNYHFDQNDYNTSEQKAKIEYLLRVNDMLKNKKIPQNEKEALIKNQTKIYKNSVHIWKKKKYINLI